MALTNGEGPPSLSCRYVLKLYVSFQNTVRLCRLNDDGDVQAACFSLYFSFYAACKQETLQRLSCMARGLLQMVNAHLPPPADMS